MRWEFIVALVVAIPIILFPVAFLWYMNIGTIYSAIQRSRAGKAVHEEETEAGIPETISKSMISEVQVFHKDDEKGTATAISHEASPSKEETNTKQTNR